MDQAQEIIPNIKKNLQIVRKKISKVKHKIFFYFIKFIAINLFIIDEKYNNKSKPKVDAIITNQKNLPIAVLTADCAPILIYDDQKK